MQHRRRSDFCSARTKLLNQLQPLLGPCISRDASHTVTCAVCTQHTCAQKAPRLHHGHANCQPSAMCRCGWCSKLNLLLLTERQMVVSRPNPAASISADDSVRAAVSRCLSRRREATRVSVATCSDWKMYVAKLLIMLAGPIAARLDESPAWRGVVTR